MAGQCDARLVAALSDRSPRGAHLGAGGATTFYFEHGEVFGWRMTIQGSQERILDSVLPHEVTHTIFATHFRQPLPRWADEGSCTTVEHSSERLKQQTMLVEFLRTGRGIAFSRMFTMKDYPHDVMPLYSQGYSVARYLIAQGGRQKFLAFLGDGMKDENWARALHAHYNYANLAVLQANWLDWVRQGSPAQEAVPQPGAAPVVASNAPRPRAEGNLIYRGQDPGSTPIPGPAAADALAATQVPLPGPVDDHPAVAQRVGRSNRMTPDEVAAREKAAGDDDGTQGWHVPRRETLESQPVSFEHAPNGPDAVATTAATDGSASANAGAADGANPYVKGTLASQTAAPPTAQIADRSGAAGYQVTRQQPVQRSRQIILEWSR